MSADAKAWYDASGNLWLETHDGPCCAPVPHDQGGQLSDVLAGVEKCMGSTLRWEIRLYIDDLTGLVGWVV
jgi:hypothetical protein